MDTLDSNANCKKVLYVSYTGILDPLGQSQVLQYVLGLADKHYMVLLTYEKPSLLADKPQLLALEKKCREAGVIWHRLTYHNRPSLIATLFDVIMGLRRSSLIVKKHKISIVHTRSYIAGIIGIFLKKRFSTKFVFDMRGFWPNERVDGGIWSESSLRYRVFKYLEKHLFLKADHIVSLTNSGVREFEKFDYLQNTLPKSSVIPTCTNLTLFRNQDSERDGFTIGYVGSVGSWYLFDDVARIVARIFEQRADAKFLVINKGGHELIESCLINANVDMGRVEVLAVPFDQVSQQIARMDAGIFFIKPAWSKRASCPTRMGEFLACGKPCLSNEGVGDVKEDFAQTKTGLTFSVDKLGKIIFGDIDQVLNDFYQLVESKNIDERCRMAAESRFSLESGIAKYDQIYSDLSSDGAEL